MGLFEALTGTTRDAARFQKSVKLGATYYSVVTIKTPRGKTLKLADEWVFDRRSPITGSPMCGSKSAAQAWMDHGPLTPHRPRGLMTLREYEAACQADADPRFLAELQARIADSARLVH